MATERKILEILREAGFDPIEDRGIVVKYAPENLSARLAQFFCSSAAGSWCCSPSAR